MEHHKKPTRMQSIEVEDDVLRIDCDDCRMQHTDTCADCIVTFVCSTSSNDAVVFDVAEARAVRAMVEVGLVPDVRHEWRTG